MELRTIPEKNIIKGAGNYWQAIFYTRKFHANRWAILTGVHLFPWALLPEYHMLRTVLLHCLNHNLFEFSRNVFFPDSITVVPLVYTLIAAKKEDAQTLVSMSMSL